MEMDSKQNGITAQVSHSLIYNKGSHKVWHYIFLWEKRSWKFLSVKNALQAAENSSTDDTAGWLCRFIQEGWLRKRWRKRWCVL